MTKHVPKASPTKADKPTFTVTFRIMPDDTDQGGYRRLRALVKWAGRTLRLNCVGYSEHRPERKDKPCT